MLEVGVEHRPGQWCRRDRRRFCRSFSWRGRNRGCLCGSRRDCEIYNHLVLREELEVISPAPPLC